MSQVKFIASVQLFPEDAPHFLGIVCLSLEDFSNLETSGNWEWVQNHLRDVPTAAMYESLQLDPQKYYQVIFEGVLRSNGLAAIDPECYDEWVQEVKILSFVEIPEAGVNHHFPPPEPEQSENGYDLSPME